ncbi:MAG: C39 family peptidase [Deltaproteobacteria bacterium]|nr:C39 family peptidase [Deltaproteobacteria bacterium]MBN2670595.1 C39 family peptidase [Deltaproteobacteria bacterium]
MIRRILQLVVFTIVLNTSAEDKTNPYSSIVISNVPHIQQKRDFCAEACAAMYLQKLGENMDQDYIFDRAEVPATKARGLYASELAFALAQIGFDTGEIWTPHSDETDLEKAFTRLHGDLLSMIPSIVLMHTSKTNPDEHFRLILGYDAAGDNVIYHEPAEKNGAYKQMPRTTFLELWSIQDEYQWGTIRIRLAPGELEYGNSSNELTDADYAQHLMNLRDRVPEGFVVNVEKPFVIVSDCPVHEVADYSNRIVRQVVTLLKKDFFLKDPEQIIDIWLLKDQDSYKFHSAKQFGLEPETPYGFYSPAHHSLILDISTGGGTLVHEMVHPFVAANFKDCPVWFNEALASLFERPTKMNGHLFGMLNWRLSALQSAIEKQSTLPLADLFQLPEEQFYDDPSGIPYAQAKYIAFYLQQQGLLVDFYHAFYENRKHDPTGMNTLISLLGIKDVNDFQTNWQSWVNQLPTDTM